MTIPVANDMTESAFSLQLRQPVFSKASGLSYKW